ncbi:hypothetical protein LG634_16960 [Streptomyces bambusae]|uniref:hypothetical protein n=1 Tax=Streptomyces bambusae TaxID=1550616 RepID=UPI001CFE1762|nr:hypothetical protein [Streptomyces bambusae]MCB5166523.1 hypothetical protein [Streptomyces bambusae]
MANSQNSFSPSWASLLPLDNETYARLITARRQEARLVPCGAGRDAVVIAPLRRGLAALDAMQLPVEAGYSVLGNWFRQELTVVVEEGWTHLWEGVPGVQVLSVGHWLLVPVDPDGGTLAASWLSRPETITPRLWREAPEGPSLAGVSARVDPRELREALSAVDQGCRVAVAP